MRILNCSQLLPDIKTLNSIDRNYIVLAEADMINSVLRNLITNAIKFTPNGGSIDIDAEAGKSYLYVSITDTGIGMDKKTLDTLFDIDSKKSRPGTNEEEGTGLGLILTKEFIEKNGGDISVKSVPGKGTTFTFSLPFMQGNYSA